MKTVIWLASIFLAVTTSQARLGKNVEECDTLYQTLVLTMSRTQNGILIKNYGTEKLALSCRFHNNICFEIGVTQLDEDGKIKSLTPEQVAALVRTNIGTIPKVDQEERTVGPNTVEHKFGTDGRFVWREEETPTGIITILRDNTLAPSANNNLTAVTPQQSASSITETYRIITADSLALEDYLKSGLKLTEEFLRQAADKHFDLWRQAAELGLPEGQFFYGACQNYGLKTPVNKSKAIEWLTKASDQDHARAQLVLGVLLTMTKPTDEAAQQSLRLWRRAAEHNLADAQYVLGIIYSTPEDQAEIGFQYLQRAAHQGHVKAQFELSVCYSKGKGCEINPQKSLLLLQEAASQNYPQAQYILALAYAEGKIVRLNFSKAAQLLRKAADGGHAEAQFELARYYYIGQGVEQSYECAISWFIAAAKQDDVTAQFLLGKCYYEGTGTSINYAEAANWYRKAAEHGKSGAQIGLAQCYLLGLGVPKDLKQAYQWILVGSKDNSEFTPAALADFEKGLTENQVREARSWATNWQPSK